MLKTNQGFFSVLSGFLVSLEKIKIEMCSRIIREEN